MVAGVEMEGEAGGTTAWPTLLGKGAGEAKQAPEKGWACNIAKIWCAIYALKYQNRECKDVPFRKTSRLFLQRTVQAPSNLQAACALNTPSAGQGKGRTLTHTIPC